MFRTCLRPGLLAATLVCAGVAAGEPEEDAPKKDAPKVDVSRVPVETILTEDTSGSRVGTFGLRLEEYGTTAYLHGYAMAALAARAERTATFELGEFHVYAGADIRGRVRPEILVMFANAPDDASPGSGLALGAAPEVGYARVDVAILGERLVARAGYFLVPIGSFNAALFPGYLHKLPRAPSMFGEVLPRNWAEVGLEVHGAFDLGEGRAWSYAAYVVNGLEQSRPPFASRDIGEMRRNLVDANHPDKAVGLRLGVDPIENVSVGAAAYTGAYTSDGQHRLSILDVDVAARLGAFTLRAEGALALQEIVGDVLSKGGLYGYAAFRAHPIAEPVVGIDLLAGDAAPRHTRLWAGAVLYPLPDLVPTLVGKAFGGMAFDPDGRLGDPELQLQLAVGF